MSRSPISYDRHGIKIKPDSNQAEVKQILNPNRLEMASSYSLHSRDELIPWEPTILDTIYSNHI